MTSATVSTTHSNHHFVRVLIAVVAMVAIITAIVVAANVDSSPARSGPARTVTQPKDDLNPQARNALDDVDSHLQVATPAGGPSVTRSSTSPRTYPDDFAESRR